MTPLYIPPRLWHAKGLGLLGRVLLAEIAEERDEAGFAERLGVKPEHIERTLGTLREMKLVVSVNGGQASRPEVRHRLTELGAEFWRPDYAPFEDGGEVPTPPPRAEGGSWVERNHVAREKDKTLGGLSVLTNERGGYTLPDDLFPRLPPEVILATARGEPCFPIGEGKKPLVKWGLYQERAPTPEEFRRFLINFPSKIWGWGRVTGRVSNLIVLDDDGGGWLEKWGLSPHVATRRGGFHWIGEYPGWRVPTINAKTSSRLAEAYPLLDIRGDGGYSVICNGAGEYEWLREPVADPLDLLPQHARRFFGLEAAPQPRRPDPPLEGASLTLEMPGARVQPELLVSYAVDIGRGRGRHNGGVWLATQLWDNGYTESECESIGRAYVQQVPTTDTRGDVDPYTAEEWEATVQWAVQQPRREPWRKQ